MPIASFGYGVLSPVIHVPRAVAIPNNFGELLENKANGSVIKLISTGNNIPPITVETRFIKNTETKEYPNFIPLKTVLK